MRKLVLGLSAAMLVTGLAACNKSEESTATTEATTEAAPAMDTAATSASTDVTSTDTAAPAADTATTTDDDFFLDFEVIVSERPARFGGRPFRFSRFEKFRTPVPRSRGQGAISASAGS